MRTDVNSNTDRKMSRTYNPATGVLVGEVPEHTVEELNEAVAQASRAQGEWASRSFAKRAAALLRVRDHLVAQIDEIAQTIAAETGKTRIDAVTTEIMPATMAATYYAKQAERILARKRLRPGNILLANKRSYVDRVPYGVIGIISPWNYPFGIPFHEVAMALMAGNAVVLKVASQTLQVGERLKEAFLAGGYPDGLFHLINLPGSVAGPAFIESGINKLFFTGSGPVGKALMAKAAERLIPVSLELGGNDAMIVCADADLDRAVGGALWAGLSNAGQSCGAVERIFVEEPAYDEFAKRLQRRFAALRVGPNEDHEVEIGSMTTAGQREKVRVMINDAVEKGAHRMTFHEIPQDAPHLFQEPAILTEVNDSMLVMQEEVFGPVLSIVRVHDLDEAVRRANASSVGLSASVWTRDRKKGHAIAARLESGAVMINDHMMSHGLAETPWGGFKESSLGRTHGAYGLEGMTQPRVVVDDIMPGVKKNMWWYPHDRAVYEGHVGGIEFLYGRGLKRRFEGLIKLVKTFLRTFRVD